MSQRLTGPPSPILLPTTHASRDSHFRRFRPRTTILRHDPGLAASPPAADTITVGGIGDPPSPLSSAVDGQPPREAAARRVRRYVGKRIAAGLHAGFSTH